MLLLKPHIPEGKVTHVIVDKNAPCEFIENLYKLKIEVIFSAELSLPGGIATHPDMQIAHLGKDTFVCEPSCFEHYSQRLAPLGLNVVKGKTCLASNYPNDIAYNIARVGRYAIHKFSYTDYKIKEILEADDVCIIDVAQGYTKCAIGVVSEKAVITADRGIAKALEKTDIDVLTIEEGNIALWGVDYGFIGGTCGLISPNILIFCGNVERHNDYPNIKKFSKKHDVDILSLCSGGLVDIGSIIPIKQDVICWSDSR